MTSCKAVLSLAVLLVASASSAFAQGTYTQFDPPGATETFGQGIDSAGDLVGYYADASGNDHGFLLSGGSYTTIDYPNAQSTYLTGINAGQIVGNTYNPELGFVYDIATQTFAELNRSGATETVPISINEGGAIAGYLYDNTGVHGFVLTGSSYRLVSPPPAVGTYVEGISDTNEVVGVAYNRQDIPVSFGFKHGKYGLLRIGETSARVLGINPGGTALVGYYELGSSSLGFLYENNTLTTLQFPGFTYTIASGINAAGEVVGTFADASNTTHGFTWTPPADAGKK